MKARDKKKIIWTTIKIPKDILPLIKTLAQKEKRAYWIILTEAINQYKMSKKFPQGSKEIIPEDKKAWYITKLGTSIGALKENPTEQNLAKTLKTLNQIETRLDVNVEPLRRVCIEYVKRKDTELRIQLNGVLKQTIIEIMSR